MPITTALSTSKQFPPRRVLLPRPSPDLQGGRRSTECRGSPTRSSDLISDTSKALGEHSPGIFRPCSWLDRDPFRTPSSRRAPSRRSGASAPPIPLRAVGRSQQGAPFSSQSETAGFNLMMNGLSQRRLECKQKISNAFLSDRLRRHAVLGGWRLAFRRGRGARTRFDTSARSARWLYAILSLFFNLFATGGCSWS